MSAAAQRSADSVGLRALARCGGCAAKVPPSLLGEITTAVAACLPDDENVLAGLSPYDDAAVYALDDRRALVASVDCFPPLVDDPCDFGRIAAANALSDIYAMGADPIFALTISGFPRAVSAQVVADVNRAAAQIVTQSGAGVLGGHSVHCAEPMFGLCVHGLVERDRIWRKQGAKPGDVLMLSKPIGTGVLLSYGDEAGVATAVASMCTTNRAAAQALRDGVGDPSAVTDVTGYGLAGHCLEVAQGSSVQLVVDARSVPLLPGAAGAVAAGAGTSADNALQSLRDVEVSSTVDRALRQLLFDPQTSGGLLAAVDAAHEQILTEAGFAAIGRVRAGPAAVRIQ